MIFGKRSRRNQHRNEKAAKRRRLSSSMSRTAKLESLEQRQLLAAEVLTLNLENADDTGVSNVDNVTSGDRFLAPGVMDFYLTAEPGSLLEIKDGNTVINGQITAGNADTQLYLSLQESETLPGGVDVENEDVIAFDGSNFSLFFDGSDVGLSATIEDVDASGSTVFGPFDGVKLAVNQHFDST